MILYGVCALWLFWRLRRSFPQIRLLAIWCADSIVVTLLIWSIAAGGLSTAITALRVSIQPGEAGMKYVTEFSSCSWYDFASLLFTIAPAP